MYLESATCHDLLARQYHNIPSIYAVVYNRNSLVEFLLISLRNPCMKIQHPGIHLSSLRNPTKNWDEQTHRWTDQQSKNNASFNFFKVGDIKIITINLSRTYLLPASKLVFNISLKALIWFSLVNSKWLAMFCMILHWRVRPRFIFGAGSRSIIPDSYGDTEIYIDQF